MRCANCGHEFDGNFCSLCGHKAVKERYSARKVASETLDTFDIERGFIKTHFLLLTRPGSSIRAHMQGDICLYNPFKLLLIIGAISTLGMANFYNVSSESEVGVLGFLDLYQQREYFSWSSHYFTFTNLVGIPLFAIASRLIFWTVRYNFFEHLVLNVYIAVMQMWILIICIPGAVLAGPDPIFQLFLGAFQYAVQIVVYVQFLGKNNLPNFIRSVLVLLIGLVLAFFSNYLLFLAIPSPFFEFFDFF